MATPAPAPCKTPKSAAASTALRRRGVNADSKVRVVVRVRPFLASERALGNQGCQHPCISLQGGEEGSQEVTVCIKDQETSRNECFELDSFYGQESNPVQVFEKEVFPLLPEVFHGHNATVFAYGATGSGKTYTMQGTNVRPGLMSLAMRTILSMSESTGRTVEIAYFEIYLERCYDLLEPKAKEISVFDNKDGRVQLKGLSQVRVSSVSEFHEVFETGVQRRKVAHTNLNDVSSRSHGVLMIVVSTREGESDRATIGKLNLIDLAGNEDNKKTCNEGVRLLESATISQSLFALSKVISALNNNKQYVPYRDSKLTRILQDSLGGTSRSLMIACLSPVSYQEAIHTVSLAARSRQILNHISTDHKQTPHEAKVDMEAKLQAWLESKGKTKSSQRYFGPFSPYMRRTPLTASSAKCPGSCVSSMKEKVADQMRHSSTGRKLFSTTAPNTTVTKEMVHLESNIHECHFDNATESCFSTRRWGTEQSSSHFEKVERKEGNMDQKVVGENLCIENRLTSQSDSKDEESVAKSSPYNDAGFPSIQDRIEALKSSKRTVFSPLDANVATPMHENLSPHDQFCVVKFKSRSPRTPPVAPCLPIAGTPLDRFNSCASGLKNFLVEEYLEFLNTANKEDLQRLKGIGNKRADYIISLRDGSPRPIKSISDLEKIGLSSKQIHGIFRTTIKGIFSKENACL